MLSNDAAAVFGVRRTRVLDFDRSRTTTLDNVGFKSIKAEVDARKNTDPKLTPKIIDYSIENGWLTEELVRGFNLAIAGRAIEHKTAVAAVLEGWRRGTVRRIQFSEYLQIVETESPWLAASPAWEELRNAMPHEGIVEIAASHGDLQPSNVMRRSNGELMLIDFEHYATRWAAYDMHVFENSSRWRGPSTTKLSPLASFEEARFLADQTSDRAAEE